MSYSPRLPGCPEIRRPVRFFFPMLLHSDMGATDLRAAVIRHDHAALAVYCAVRWRGCAAEGWGLAAGCGHARQPYAQYRRATPGEGLTNYAVVLFNVVGREGVPTIRLQGTEDTPLCSTGTLSWLAQP